MVTVKYYPHAVNGDAYIYSVNRLADFLRQPQFDREDLVNMRFFNGDVLGDEIDTEDGSFIDICNGEVTVIDSRTFPGEAVTIGLIVGAVLVTTLVTTLLMPQPKVPNTNKSSKTKTSSTNALSGTQNEVNLGGRIEDVYGTVNKHVPTLWQQPYRFGINDRECEVTLLCVGRGKYDINLDEIYDGRVPYKNISGSMVNVYEGDNPEPVQVLNNDIRDFGYGSSYEQSTPYNTFGIYSQVSGFNPAELEAPDQKALSNIRWRIRKHSTDLNKAVITPNTSVSNLLSRLNIRDNSSYFEMFDCFLKGSEQFVTVYDHYDNPDQLETFTPLDVSGTYNVDYDESNNSQIVITGFDFTWLNENIVQEFIYDGFSVMYEVDLSDGSVTTSYYHPYSYIPAGWKVSIGDFTTTGFKSHRMDNCFYSPTVNQTGSNWVGPFFTDKTVSRTFQEVYFNLSSNNGFYYVETYNDSGNTYNREYNVTMEFCLSHGEVPVKNRPREFTYGTSIKGRKDSVYRTFGNQKQDVNSLALWVRRKSNTIDSDTDRTRRQPVDKIELASVYSKELLPSGHSFGDVTLLHVLTPNNTQSQLVKNRETNLNVTRRLTQYLGNGQFGPSEGFATDQFDQILINMALDPYNGRLDLNQIDVDGILMLRNQIINYFGSDKMTKFGYVFDDVEIPFGEMYETVCTAVNCFPYVQNGVYSAFFDSPQPTSALQITHRNKVPDSEVREDIFERENDGVELTYRSNETGKPETIYVPNEFSNNPKKTEIAGVTTELQAYRRAWRDYNRQRYQVVNTEFQTDEFGRMLVPGQRIDSPDSTRFVRRADNTDGYRIYDGEVVEVNGLSIELSQPVDFVDGEDHYIQFTKTNGDNSELIQCTPGLSEFHVVLNNPPTESIHDGYQRDKTKFTFCSEQVRQSVALIVQGIEFKLDDNKEINTISCVNYDDRYYLNDFDTPSGGSDPIID